VFDDTARRDRGGAGRYTYVRRCAAARAGDGETSRGAQSCADLV